LAQLKSYLEDELGEKIVVTSQNPEMQPGLPNKPIQPFLERCYECSLGGKSNDQTTHATHKCEESSMCQCTANLFYEVTSVRKN